MSDTEYDKCFNTVSATKQPLVSQECDMSSALPAMEKLDDNTDFNTRKFLMKIYRIHEVFWEFTTITPAAGDASRWKKDHKAQAKIGLMVEPHCLIHVRNAKVTKDAWDALKSAF